MIHESIGIFFESLYDEYFFLLEESLSVEDIYYPYTTHAYQDRVKCREYPYIDDDESRDFFLEEKSCREIDESNIDKKPEYTLRYHFSDGLEDWFIRDIGIEPRTREYHPPEQYSKKYKRDKLCLTDIGYP